MLQAVRPNPQRQAVSSLLSLPPPTGGLNAVDPLARMKPTDAIVMENVFPAINGVSVRGGYGSPFSGGSVVPVQSLMTYHASNGVEKLFAAKSAKIYQCGSSSTLTSVYSTAITVNKWQTINFSNTAGQWLLAANGTDYQLRYNGSNWSVNAIGGSIASSGKTIINIFQFKERVFMIEKNTLNLWYLASQSISGTATKLPLGGVFNKGGQILAGGAFSFDAGAGLDDYLVAVTDNGEAAIYSGITPATDFALKGVYEVGQPVGNRCLTQVGGDLVVITTKGAVPISQMIMNDRAKADQLAITAKIAPKFNQAVSSYIANFGWQAFLYPKGGYALFNVPVAEGSSQYQWVQNVITGAWCKFTGWNGNCFGLYNDNLYFGGNDGKVYKADSGRQDNGGQISWELKTAFNYCGSPGQNKLFTALRPLLLMGGVSAVSAGVDVDFGDMPPAAATSSSPGTAWVWDTSTWNNFTWGGTGLVVNNWVGLGSIGACVAVHLKGGANGIAVDINGFDVLYQKSKGQVF